MYISKYDSNSPNFNARFINTTNVLARAKDGHMYPKEVSVIELKDRYIPDVKVLEKIADNWSKQKSGFIASDIYNESVNAAKAAYESDKTHVVYAITSEKFKGNNQKIKKLDPQKILGIATTIEREKDIRDYLSCLQVNPKYNVYAKETPEFKKIGNALVKFIRNYREKPLEITAANEAVGFYEKIGCYRPFPKESKYKFYLD